MVYFDFKAFKMVLWMCGVTKLDNIRIEKIRGTHWRNQDFCLWGGHSADATQLCISGAQHTFEAVSGSWGFVSAPAVNRVMGGAPERKKI